jgi:hypothetical protein
MSAPIQNLDEWLKTATGELWFGELAGPAKERIKLEIKSHFEDAVAAHQTEGLTGTEAQARALADLGDAHAAAKRFRKTHLTEWEAKRLLSCWSVPRSMSLVVLFGAPLISLCLIFYFLTKTHLSLLVPGILGIVFLLAISISVVVARRHDFRVHPRCLLGLDLFQKVMPRIIFPMAIPQLWGWDGFSFLLVVLLGTSIFNFPTLRLWLKLWKTPEVAQELPPPGQAAA